MKKNRENKANKITKNKKINKIIIIGIIAAIAIAIGFAATTNINTPSSSNANAAAPIDGISCGAMEANKFHIHSQLNIFINGQPFVVPAEIGITDTCLYWLHTHDDTGIVHIESPETRNFTLGNLFNIWNKKFDNHQLFDNVVNGTNSIDVYVNGTKVPNETNYRDISLKAHDVITITYGKPPASIPSKYDFGSL